MRRNDWYQRLVQYLESVAIRPYEDGVHDCALFFAGAVEAMTGVDYAEPYRGRYSTIRGGIRILRKDGFDDHVALAAHHLKEKPVSFANVGDGAVIETEDGPSLGVVQGEYIYALGPEGQLLFDLTTAVRCFEV